MIFLPAALILTILINLVTDDQQLSLFLVGTKIEDLPGTEFVKTVKDRAVSGPHVVVSQTFVETLDFFPFPLVIITIKGEFAIFRYIAFYVGKIYGVSL